MIKTYIVDKREDLASEIASVLERKCKDSSEERYKMACGAVNALLELGDYAIFRALVEYGARLATEKSGADSEVDAEHC